MSKKYILFLLLIVLLLFILAELFINSGNSKKGKEITNAIPHKVYEEKAVTDTSSFEDKFEDNFSNNNSTTFSTDQSSNYFGLGVENEATKKYENLLVFDVKDTMEIHKAYISVLGLAKNETIENLRNEVLQSTDPNAKTLIDTSIKLTGTMSASLTDVAPGDDPDFNITRQESEQIQNLDSLTDYKSFWQWKIEPLKEGQHQLLLDVEMVVNGRKHKVPAKKYDIIIFSQPSNIFSDIGRFISNNWQWLISAILIPLFLLWVDLRKHKTKREEETALKEKRTKTIKMKNYRRK